MSRSLLAHTFIVIPRVSLQTLVISWCCISALPIENIPPSDIHEVSHIEALPVKKDHIMKEPVPHSSDHPNQSSKLQQTSVLPKHLADFYL